MSIELRQYVPGDEKLIEPVEDTLRSHPNYEDEWDRLVLPEYTWTGWMNDRLVGLGGLIPYETDAYVWIQLDKNAPDKFAIARSLRDIVRFGESFGFSLLWTFVQSKFKEGCRLIRFLGFEQGEQVGNCYKYFRKVEQCLIR